MNRFYVSDSSPGIATSMQLEIPYSYLARRIANLPGTGTARCRFSATILSWPLPVNSLSPWDAYIRQTQSYHGIRNSLQSVCRQAVILIIDGLLVIGNNFQWFVNRHTMVLMQENAFQNLVWKMVVILLRLKKLMTLVNGASHSFQHVVHRRWSKHCVQNSMYITVIDSYGSDTWKGLEQTFLFQDNRCRSCII